MNIEEVKELLVRVDQSSLKEFDLREGSFRLYMNKHNQGTVQGSSQSIEEKEVALSSDVPNQISPEKVEFQNKEPIHTAISGENIVSPIVGVVYLKPAPDKENFKQKGDTVKKGEVICIVEAMKLMNEITSTVDGVISEIFVENEEVVEFNQPLFCIDKGASK